MATKKKQRVIFSSLYQVTASEDTSLARETFFVVADTATKASAKVEANLSAGWSVTMVNYLGDASSKYLAFE
jgi:hypothetical protein